MMIMMTTMINQVASIEAAGASCNNSGKKSKDNGLMVYINIKFL